jgi:hypothetical protein
MKSTEARMRIAQRLKRSYPRFLTGRMTYRIGSSAIRSLFGRPSSGHPSCHPLCSQRGKKDRRSLRRSADGPQARFRGFGIREGRIRISMNGQCLASTTLHDVTSNVTADYSTLPGRCKGQKRAANRHQNSTTSGLGRESLGNWAQLPGS